ncbi:hypothetical protein DESPIG_01051 [Desulfovibrio piger ATCC 29098]|uniref:Uncharacterized protein n=1 Tax=Desulfovibrio piger ATCC 29098 TaxID=411464 RepID=B6WSC9_9BACT|nr:hypothetical protein DESPIG_01051 [Desulfovibrio piger ATCC 29098]
MAGGRGKGRSHPACGQKRLCFCPVPSGGIKKGTAAAVPLRSLA